MAVSQSLGQVHQDFLNTVPVVPLASFVDGRVLTGANEDHTVPTGAAYVIITASANIRIKRGGTATAAADVTDGTSSTLLFAGVPRYFALAGATTIGLLGTADVTLEWFLA